MGDKADLQWSRGRYRGKTTTHFLRAAFERITAGESETDVMADYGYVMLPANLAARAEWHKQQMAECYRKLGVAP